MKNTLKIRLTLRLDKRKPSGKCPIYLILNLNGKEFKLSTGKFLEQKDWDKRLRRPKTSHSNLRRLLNQQISALETFFSDKILRGEKVTKQILKDFYKGTDNKDFYAYVDKLLLLKRKTERERTILNYVGTIRHIKKFRESIAINEIDLDFVIKFDFYLRVTCGLKNGAWARHKDLKAIINNLIRDGLLENNPYGKGKFSVQKYATKPTFLDEEDIRRIVAIRPTLSDKMQINIDRFLMCCYTGFRYSDMVSLKWEHIKDNGTIRKRMVKTEKEVVVPISDGVKKILSRYTSTKEEYIFPKISNDKFNKALKVIRVKTKISKRLSSHVGRHTFGYILGKNGVNAFKIMELMGHTNVKQTMIYVKACLTDLTSAVNGIDAFKKAN